MSFVVALVALVLAALAAASAPPHPITRINVRSIALAQDADIQLDVTPQTFNATSNWVTVSWANVPNPSIKDWIGLYESSDVVNQTAPIKYQYASVSQGYLKSGSGSLRVQIVNIRANHVFVFFRNGLSTPVAAAQSPDVVSTNPNYPYQPRIALVEESNAIRVTWTTRDEGTDAHVVYYIPPSQEIIKVAANTSTYTRQQMCGAPATTVGFRNPGLFHSAIIDRLLPGQVVHYRYGDSVFGMSEEHTFSAPAAPASAVNVIAFGDLGQWQLDDTVQEAAMHASYNTTTAILQEIESVDMIHHIGDISYARGYMSQWEQYHVQIEDIVTRAPYMVGIGNHERDWPNSGSLFNGTDSGGECGVAYETRFPMPTRHDEPWYAYAFGPLYFIVMSTEHNFGLNSPQYNFFVKALAAVNRTQTPWVIFSGHRPFYIDSTNFAKPDGDQTVATEMRDTFEDLLYQNKVDLIFGAHHHSYQRTCPVYKNKCMTADKNGYAGPVVVDLGMAGADNSQNLEPKRPEIFVFVNDNTHGYTRIAANATHFHLDFVEGAERSVLDKFTLTK